MFMNGESTTIVKGVKGFQREGPTKVHISHSSIFGTWLVNTRAVKEITSLLNGVT